MKYRKSVNPKQRYYHTPRSKQHAKYVFKPHNPLVRWSFGYRPQPVLPFKVDGYNFSVTYGLRLKPRSYFWLRSIIIVTSILATLPLLWWLNSSSASISSTEGLLKKSLLPAPKVTTKTPDAAYGHGLFTTSLEQPTSQVQVKNQPTAGQAIPIPTKSLSPWLHLTLKSGDTLAGLFEQHQLNKTQLHQILAVKPYGQQLQQLHLEQKLHIKHDTDGNIQDLILFLNDHKKLHFYRENQVFQGEIKPSETNRSPASQCGTVKELTLSANQGLYKQLVEIFQRRINFDPNNHTVIKFCVIYEQDILAQAENDSDILAAEMIYQGKTYRAIRYTDPIGYTDYYTSMGDSWHQIPLLNAPVEFTRVSSHFGDRKHPTLNRFHFHTGIDYAAPWGTPIVAAGDAMVSFIGRKGGYGKTIILEHNKRIHTLYAHLSKYESGLKVGDQLIKGQVIGYIGRSGRATGPHLHYEIQRDGIPIDPLQAKSPVTMPIAEENLLHFFATTQQWVNKLNAVSPFSPTRLAKNTTFNLAASTTSAKWSRLMPMTSLLEQHSLQQPAMPRMSR